MREKLTLVVQSGPMIGDRIEVVKDSAVIGGTRSGADLEVSGVTYGIKVAEVRTNGKRWLLEEISDGTVRLNGRRPGRRNVLSTGHVFTVPGVRAEEPVSFEVVIERVKAKGADLIDIDLSWIKPQWVAFVSLYLGALVVAAVFLSLEERDGPVRDRPEVSAMLREDISSSRTADWSGFVASSVPQSFNELMVFLAAGGQQGEEDRVIEDFVLSFQRRFAEARRLADNGLTAEAQAAYEGIIDLLDDGTLATTNLALRELMGLRRQDDE
jgi:hypothetical protein